MERKRFASTVELTETYSAVTRALELHSKQEDKAFDGGIFHYTSTEVLDKILSTACFWASNLYYVNDAQEYLEGLRRLEEALSDVRDKNPVMWNCLRELRREHPNAWEGLYTISFSRTEDSLQNWITYAKESGVCIEMDVRTVTGDGEDISPLLLKQKPHSGDAIRPIKASNCFHQILYNNTLNYDLISQAFRACSAAKLDKSEALEDEFQWKENRLFLKRFLRLLASYHKQEGFNGEREVRLSFFPLSADEDLCADINDPAQSEAEIKYLCQRSGILRPYLEIYFFDWLNNKDACPITAITVGPGGHQQTVFDSVVHRLQYGICKLWTFDREKKETLLKRFLEGCLPQIQKKEDQERIIPTMAREWADRAGFFVKTCEVEGKSVSVELSEDPPHTSLCDISEKDEEPLAALLRDNYLSTQGVWVKKSKIPYIF